MKSINYYVLFLICWISPVVCGQDNPQDIFHLSGTHDILSKFLEYQQSVMAQKKSNSAASATQTDNREDLFRLFDKYGISTGVSTDKQNMEVQKRSNNQVGRLMTAKANTPSRMVVDVGTYSEQFQFVHTQDTRLTPDAYRPPDWAWEDSPNDVFYRFTLEVPMAILVNIGSTSNKSYFIEEDLGTGQLTLIKPMRSVLGVQLAFLPSGTYYIVSEGSVDSHGVVSNEEITTQVVGIPHRLEAELGVFSSDTSLVVSRDTRRASNEYGSMYNDIFYKFELSHYMDISASLASSELDQINLYLLDSEESLVSSSQSSRLDAKQLSPGIYYLIVEGAKGNGLISMNVRTRSLDKVIIDIGSYSQSFRYNHTIDTRLTPDAYRPSGWQWEKSPNDVFYRFTLETPMVVLVQSKMDSTDCSFYIEEENMSRDSLMPIQKKRLFSDTSFAILPKGAYYFILEGGIDKDGSIINGEIETFIMAIPQKMQYDLGYFTTNTLRTITGDTRRTSNAYGNPSRNDIYYKFSLKRPMKLSASLNDLGLNNINMYLLDLSENKIASSQDGNLTVEHLPAISYNLVVEGGDSDGIFSVNLEFEPQELVIDLGKISGNKNISETFNTAESENRFGLSPNEIFYKLELTKNMGISLSNRFSGNSTDGRYATAIYLLDVRENIIQSTQDGGTGLTIENLPAGIYYIVSEGITQNMDIITEISTTYQDLDLGINNHNYILTRTYTTSDGSDSRVNIDYFDGLGRSSGSVLVGSSPLGKDIVTRRDYDGFGRLSREWLARVSDSSNGRFVTPTEFEGLSAGVYDNDTHTYSLTVYENSPLSRVLEQYGPGQSWQESGHSVKNGYLTNISGNDTLNCVCYMATHVGDTVLELSAVRDYATGSLYVTRTTDEDGNATLTFKDKLDRAVLTRQIAYEAGVKDFYDTYYIYDDFGNVTAVLPPKAAEGFRLSGAQRVSSSSNSLLRDYAFLYQYDGRNRCIAKKLPGCDWVFYIYDKGDRLVFSQDGNQRREGKWSFSIPDVFGRVVLTGTCRNTFNYSSSPLSSSVVKGVWNNTTNAMKGYSVTGVSLLDAVVLAANYYDSYEFLGKNGIPASTSADVSYEPEQEQEGFGKRYMTSSKGLLTGTLTARLTDQPSLSPYLYVVMYYDYQGRVVQTKSSNHLSGGVEKDYFRYDFTGQTLGHKHIHSATGQATQTEVYSYTYDHAGRLLTTAHQLNGGTSVVLADNTYDELGRLRSTQHGTHANLKTDYAYNIRSWTKSISSPLFRQTLYYNDRRAGNGAHAVYYNGNISAMDWTAGDGKVRGYDFSYDNLSRLKDASYLEGNVKSGKFSASYHYDKHGNMLSLTRSGNQGTGTYGVVDNLTLTYSGNQLVKVEDTAPDPSLSMSMDFKNGASQPVEYIYDDNGNQTQDLNKGISNIEYNILNMPRRVTFTGLNNPVNEYVYSAGGKKLSVIHKSSTEKRTDYVGNMIYENGSLKRILVEGGYIENGIYHFYLQDHLGNNRVIAKSDGTVVQTNHYYPYGMSFAESTYRDKQPYKYNGKELDTENGLNLYDYEARQMEAICGRFTGIDPMAEKYYAISPYVYCANNPLKYIDPNGCDWYQSTNNEDEYIWREGHKDIDGYTRLGSSMSIQIGEDSYLNFYQNAGIKANKAVNAFDLINSSGKLQNKLLGKNSPLSEKSKSELFNGLNSRAVDDIARPIGETIVESGIGTLAGGLLGKAVGYALGRITAKWGTQTLFRAVSKAELDDIVEFGMRNRAGYETGKLFATTVEDAARYGKYNFKLDHIPNTIIKVKVPNNVMRNAYRFEADFMNAVSIDSKYLQLLKVTPLNYTPLP